ncbi:MAG: hypothetical protein QNK05_21125 [Myxococcota bacterium]|nr:hypothetical protein [Myxococcota bacterium]
MRRLLVAASVGSILAFASASGSAPVSLAGWQSDVSADNICNTSFSGTPWVVQPGGTAARVEINNNCSSFFASDFDALGTSIQLDIAVDSDAGDNDYIGFALGYDPGDAQSALAEYLVLSWSNGGAGLALLEVSGVAGSAIFVTPPPGPYPTGVIELARGASDPAGWVHGRTYRFDVLYSPNRVTISIDDPSDAAGPVTEFDVLGSFSPGGLAFYNFSQQQVEYSNVMVTAAEPTWTFASAVGCLALIISRRRKH